MAELASHGQLRLSLFRWALVLIPGILLLGMLSAALAGSGPADPWFAGLNKPSIYPPPQLFPIVWSALYILMGLALAMIVWARGAAGRKVAIVAFAVQLALNLAWSPLFFAAHQITAALVLIVALDVAVLATIVLFHRVRPVAALLLAPYLVWLLFASYLNWEFRTANPNADGQEVSGAAVRVEF
jgi:tryptophan-rich sensory protein